MSARVQKCRIIEDQAAVFLARLHDHDGNRVTQASLASITWGAFNSITGTSLGSGSLTIADVIYDALQTAAIWTADAVGFNFKARLPASAFATGDAIARVDFKFTDNNGDVFFVLYECEVVAVLGS